MARNKATQEKPARKGRSRKMGIADPGQPVPVKLLLDDQGQPREVKLRREWVAVVEVSDTWEVEDWWGEETISRRYFSLVMADERRLTVFQNQADGKWYLLNL